MGGGVHYRPLPHGDVCFLFTDVESSTALLRELGSAQWAAIKDQMHRVIRDAVESRGGTVVNTEGDGSFVVFATADAAAHACADAQRQLQSAGWSGGTEVRVRMGLHLGIEVEPVDTDYVALAVHQAARVMSAAHGRQVLATSDVVSRVPEADLFTDLGLYSVRDFDGPVRLYGLVQPGVPNPRPAAPPAFDTRVPSYLTALVGRDAEIADVIARTETASLVTVTGPNGIGKTRVAVAALSMLAADLPVGPWFVDLTAADQPGAVGEVIADAIGCPPETDIGVHLDTVLDGRPGVLVLDHCEHLRDAAASAAALLLEWCPTLRVIATSRMALGIDGETTYELPPMGLPTGVSAAEVLASESGRLFLERASRSQSDFELSDTAARVVRDVCAYVDGVPLALELAAAWPTSTGRHEITDSVSDGSLPAVIDHSLDLLDPVLLRALAALSVPTSPVPPALAISAVTASGVDAADAAQVLETLVQRSVLRRDPDERFDLLRTMHARVRERLSDDDRHSVLRGLLDACIEQTAGELGPLAKYAHYATTASMVISLDELSPELRQRLAVQLVPWWVGRLGPRRARDLLMNALSLGDSGTSAAALHLAIADTYAAGHETVDTEWHIQRAAVLLGEHDAIDPDLIERLKASASHAAHQNDREDDREDDQGVVR